jgi:hypothetical protein
MNASSNTHFFVRVAAARLASEFRLFSVARPAKTDKDTINFVGYLEGAPRVHAGGYFDSCTLRPVRSNTYSTHAVHVGQRAPTSQCAVRQI